ncbi:MAG: GldG family protein, partial [Nitrospira sp.]|nr:GldG family protein [Nitrospira sp.]
LTAAILNTLSEKSVKILKSLDRDVQAIVFFQKGQERGIHEVLDRYAYYSPRFKYEIVDPDHNPGRAKAYEIRDYGTIVLESGDKREKITDASEEAITNAILKVTREGKKVVYFLTGHNEGNLNESGAKGYSQVKKATTDKNYEVKELLLLRENRVPSDASILIINGPKKDLLPKELESLDVYIKQGGKLLVMLDPENANSLATFLEKYGFKIGNNVVVDRLSRIFGADPTVPIVSQYEPHEITKGFQVASFFPWTRSVGPLDQLPEGVTAQPLAKTGPESWGETDIEELKRGTAHFDAEKDLRGPVSVAAVATVEIKEGSEGTASEEKPEESKPQDTKKARIVAYGDSDFASDSGLNLSGNGDLFLNTVSWLAEEETLIAIRPKERQSQPILMSVIQGRLTFWVPVVFLPAAVLVAGSAVYLQRRNRSK